VHELFRPRNYDPVKKYKPEDIPAGHSTMGSRFTMRAKTNKQGATSRYKVRLVVQATEQPNSSFKDTFALTAKFPLICLLLVIAARIRRPPVRQRLGLLEGRARPRLGCHH
jgi:hypothetical protein